MALVVDVQVEEEFGELGGPGLMQAWGLAGDGRDGVTVDPVSVKHGLGLAVRTDVCGAVIDADSGV